MLISKQLTFSPKEFIKNGSKRDWKDGSAVKRALLFQSAHIRRLTTSWDPNSRVSDASDLLRHPYTHTL